MSRLLGPDGKPIPTQAEIDHLMSYALVPITRFQADMILKFQRRAYKGYWRHSGPTTAMEALTRLRQETDELAHALLYEDGKAIRSEAADIGNIGVMVHEMADDWIVFREARIMDYRQGRITKDQLMRAIDPMVPEPEVPVA